MEPGFRVFANLKIGAIKILNERKTFDGQTTRVAEVIVGDETGCVIFFAKEESLNKIKEGDVFTFYNAHAAVVKEHMRIEVDKWAQLQKSTVKIGAIKLDNNLSNEEYEKIPPEGKTNNRRGGRRGGRRP